MIIDKCTSFFEDETKTKYFQTHFDGVGDEEEVLDGGLDIRSLTCGGIIQNERNSVEENDEEHNVFKDLMLNNFVADEGDGSEMIIVKLLENEKNDFAERKTRVVVSIDGECFEFILMLYFEHGLGKKIYSFFPEFDSLVVNRLQLYCVMEDEFTSSISSISCLL
jgi:hypothetical protein